MKTNYLSALCDNLFLKNTDEMRIRCTNFFVNILIGTIKDGKVYDVYLCFSNKSSTYYIRGITTIWDRTIFILHLEQQ